MLPYMAQSSRLSYFTCLCVGYIFKSVQATKYVCIQEVRYSNLDRLPDIAQVFRGFALSRNDLGVLKCRILRTFADFTHRVTLKGLLSHQSEIFKASNMHYAMDTTFWFENFVGMDHLGNEGDDIR